MKIDKKDKEREKEIVLHFDVYYGGKILHYYTRYINNHFISTVTYKVQWLQTNGTLHKLNKEIILNIILS